MDARRPYEAEKQFHSLEKSFLNVDDDIRLSLDNL